MESSTKQAHTRNKALKTARISTFFLDEELVTFSDGQSWGPLFTKNVKADAAVAINIRVINL